MPLPPPRCASFEVKRGGDLVGIFIADNFARPSKQGGAWMSGYRWQTRNTESGAVIPIIGNHNNFSKPPGRPGALFTFDDVRIAVPTSLAMACGSAIQRAPREALGTNVW